MAQAGDRVWYVDTHSLSLVKLGHLEVREVELYEGAMVDEHTFIMGSRPVEEGTDWFTDRAMAVETATRRLRELSRRLMQLADELEAGAHVRNLR